MSDHCHLQKKNEQLALLRVNCTADNDIVMCIPETVATAAQFLYLIIYFISVKKSQLKMIILSVRSCHAAGDRHENLHLYLRL